MTSPPEPLDVYFYLSHVRSRVADHWIYRFHQALDLAVESKARPAAGLALGSIYLNTAGKAARLQSSGSLPEARVIVPLYTREFLHDPPPEYKQFERAHRKGARRPCLHPVFWDANPGGRQALGLDQARTLGKDLPDYEEYGLAAMCRLNAFATSYRAIVDRLAERIVTAAEHPETSPSWAAGEDATTTEPSAEASFVISLIAPDGQQWSPFPSDDATPITLQAQMAARRLMLLPEVVEYDPADAVVRDSPGVLLIDLWAVDDARLEPRVRQALAQPPLWAGIVAVVGSRVGRPETRREALLDMAAELTRQSIRTIVDERDVAREIDEVIHRSRRSYLRGQPPNRNRGGDRR
jgi:hypothetical protein